MKELRLHFNTSHVTVYPRRCCIPFLSLGHFNTSHVTVYQITNIPIHMTIFYFNTSHVTVYLCSTSNMLKNLLISIHLMLRFIYVRYNQTECVYNFNTSHVTVYPDIVTAVKGLPSHFNTSHVTVYRKLFAKPPLSK